MLAWNWVIFWGRYGRSECIFFCLEEDIEFPVLSEEDKAILDIVIEKLGKMTKNQIVSFMYREQAYVETAPRDVIQFKYAESLQI